MTDSQGHTRCPYRSQSGERKEMPMIFYLDPELPRHINTLTLSYTIFDVTDRVAATNK